MARSDSHLEYGLSMPADFVFGLLLLSAILEENEADDELPAQDPVPANRLDIPSAVIVPAETSNVSPIPPHENQSNIETDRANDLLAFQQQEQEIFGTPNQRVHMVSSYESVEPPPEDSDTDSEGESIEQDMESVPVIPDHSVGAHLQLKVLIEDSEHVEPVIRGSESEASGAANNIAESVLPEHQASISSPPDMPPVENKFTKELRSQMNLKDEDEVPVSLAMFPVTDHGVSVPVKKAADDGNAPQLEGDHQ